MISSISIRSLAAAIILAAAGISGAQNYNSFEQGAVIDGITVTTASDGFGGTDFTVHFATGATYSHGSQVDDPIKGIGGFFLVGSSEHSTPIGMLGTPPKGWSDDSKGGYIGFSTGPGYGSKTPFIKPGQELTFDFSSPPSGYVLYGLDVSLARGGLIGSSGCGDSQTGRVTMPVNPAPEPATLGLLGLGAVALIRKRARA